VRRSIDALKKSIGGQALHAAFPAQEESLGRNTFAIFSDRHKAESLCGGNR
jgi:hypothetical protein